jgi:putative ABC transport system permease protein
MGKLQKLKRKMLLHSLFKSSLRYLLKHPWQFGLSVIGIAMGVAIVVSIDIANYSSSKAFNISMNSVAGKATHQIKGGSDGIPDSLYTRLKTEKGIEKIAPIIESYVKLDDSTRTIFKLLGVDFFAEAPFRDFLKSEDNNYGIILNKFLVIPNSVVISSDNLDRLNKKIGDTLPVLINGKKKILKILHVIEPKEENKYALENIIIADIATAQELTEKIGKLDYIDVIIQTPVEESNLRELLPANFQLERSGSRTKSSEQMLDAFEINLTALSLLALIVGLFLVYNTMTFSVVQRRILIGTLRSIGVTSNEITKLIFIEALILGILGTVLGFLIAFFMSKFLIIFISQAINDLYFVVSVREIYISNTIIIKGILLGILATLLSAIKPAKEASSVYPRIALSRSDQESRLIRNIPKMSFIGIIFILLGGATLIIPSKNIWFSYFGILPVIIGFALLTPIVIKLAEKIFTPVYKKVFGIIGKMSSKSILQNISRTYIAIAALSLAVAATVGVGTMINSFRSTVVEWLEARLNADLFITAPSLVSRRNDAVLSEELLTKIKNSEGVEEINFYREIDLFQNEQKFRLIASGISEKSYSGFQFKDGNKETVFKQFEEGAILLSEPFAYKYNYEVGDKISLRTDYGFRNFNVAGIYYDYASDEGLITIQYNHFQKYWKTKGVSGISIFVDKKYSINEVKESIQSIDTKGQDILIRTNKFLRETSIEIFDRTFLIAKALQFVAVIVAFIGILSSLMSIQLERKKELGILRANGFLPIQIFKMINLQTLLMGIITAFLALPLGNILAAILVFIINKRSFGWTMQFEILPSVMLEGALLAILTAIIAGIYPGYKMAKTSPALALREE